MKNILTAVLLPVAMAAMLPSLSAEQTTKLRKLAEARAPEAKAERHVFVHRLNEKKEMESVPFLGVETAPVSPALTAQLGLPKDAGLVVRNVVPDSPAATTLQVHDILLKLDDQLLIDSRQFSVLIRNHKEGEEVTLTYVRSGKQATVKIKLTTHEVPKMAFFGIPGTGAMRHLEFPGNAPEAGALQEGEMDHVLSLLDQNRGTPSTHRPKEIRSGGGGYRALSVNLANSNMVFTDDEGSLELTIKDGKKNLVAKSSKGEELYSGPVDTPEQRKALPDPVRARLDKLEGMEEFSFEPDGKFRTDVKVLHAAPSQISVPLPPPGHWTGAGPTAAF